MSTFITCGEKQRERVRGEGKRVRREGERGREIKDGEGESGGYYIELE